MNSGPGGMMMPVLKAINPPDSTYVFYIYDENKRIAAWALTSKILKYNDVTKDLNIWTQTRYRRRGLGTRLMKYVAKHHKKLTRGKMKYYRYCALSFFNHCDDKGFITKSMWN